MKAINKLISILLAITLLGTNNHANAQGRKKKKKVVYATLAIEYPAEPEDPFYKMTVELPAVDQVELLYVTSLPKNQELSAEQKTIDIHGQRYLIAAHKILEKQEAEEFAAQWRKLLRGPGAGCFAPAFRIKFWARKRLLLETDVCYHCHNLTLPNGERSEIRGFNAEGKSGLDLLKRLKTLLPESDIR